MFEPKLNGQCVRTHVPRELFCNQKLIRELKSFEYYHVKSKKISVSIEKNEMKPAEMNLLHHQLVIQLTVPSIWWSNKCVFWICYYPVKSNESQWLHLKKKTKCNLLKCIYFIINLSISSLFPAFGGPTNVFFGFAIILSRAKKVSGCTYKKRSATY
jgi:hypothetical protein